MSIAGSKWVEYKAAAMEFQQSTTLGPTADNDDLTISVSTNADITIDTSTNGDIYISPYDDLVMSSGLASGNMLILDGGTRSVLIQSGNVGVAPSLEIDHLDDTVFAGNSLGRLNFRTHDVASAVTGRIQLTAEADHNTGDIRTYMSFHPNDGVGGTLPEIFRISTTSVTVFGNSGTSDSRILFDVGGTDWHIGIDDSDADKLTIGAGTLVGSSRAIELFQDAQGDAHLAWGNNQSVDARFGWRLDGEITPGVGDNGFLHHYEGTIVEAGSGTHARLAQLSINAPTINSGRSHRHRRRYCLYWGCANGGDEQLCVVRGCRKCPLRWGRVREYWGRCSGRKYRASSGRWRDY